MVDKKKIDVTIGGHNFTVIGTDDEDYVRNLSYYVDKRIRQLTSKNNKLNLTMSATLAALNIADELQKLEEKHADLIKSTKGPIEDYNKVINELKSSKRKIQELEKQCLDYKDEAVKEKLSKEDSYKKINDIRGQLENKDLEIMKLRDLNKVLQDKNIEGQKELIDYKRQINEIQKTMRKHKK